MQYGCYLRWLHRQVRALEEERDPLEEQVARQPALAVILQWLFAVLLGISWHEMEAGDLVSFLGQLTSFRPVCKVNSLKTSVREMYTERGPWREGSPRGGCSMSAFLSQIKGYRPKPQTLKTCTF